MNQYVQDQQERLKQIAIEFFAKKRVKEIEQRWEQEQKDKEREHRYQRAEQEYQKQRRKELAGALKEFFWSKEPQQQLLIEGEDIDEQKKRYLMGILHSFTPLYLSLIL